MNLSKSSEKLKKDTQKWQEGENTIQQHNFNKEIFETLYLAYKPFVLRISFLIFFGFLARVLILGNTNIVGFWVDSLCQGNQFCHPIPLLFSNYSENDYLLLMFILAIIGFILTIAFRVLFSRWSAEAVSSLYDETTLRTSRRSMSFFDTTPAGRIITRFSSDYGNVFRLFGGPLAEFLSIIFDIIAMVILTFIANPLFLFFIVFIALLNYGVYKLNQNNLRKTRRDLSSSRSPSISHFAETAQGANTIRSFQKESSFTQRFQLLNKFYLTQRLKTNGHLISFSFQMNTLSAFLLLITGIFSFFMIQKGLISIGSVGVAFSFIIMSGNTLSMFFEWLAQFEEAIIGVERLNQYLRAPLEWKNQLPHTANFETFHQKYSAELNKHDLLKEKAVRVEVNHLSFRYSPDLPWVLNDIHFSIKEGEKIGVIGKTGSGKSSLIQALFYLYPIEKGHLSIHGFSPQNDSIDLNLYRQSISFIAQDPVLFNGTLKENLDPYNQFSVETILSVLHQVNLKDWVLTNPLHVNLVIEERGKNLSLGERQLICLARCLLQNAPLVIMDEATSSVDPQSEEIMIKATEEFFEGRTQIIIAHRLSTLKKCDKVLWIDHGQQIMFDKTNKVLEAFLSASKSHTKEI